MEHPLGWNVEDVPVSELRRFREIDRRAYPSNTPEDLEALRASIREEGVREPLTVEYDPGHYHARLADGNNRLMLAEDEGLTHVPVRVERRNHPFFTDEFRNRPVDVPGLEPDEGGYLPKHLKPSEIGLPTQALGKSVETEPLQKAQGYGADPWGYADWLAQNFGTTERPEEAAFLTHDGRWIKPASPFAANPLRDHEGIAGRAIRALDPGSDAPGFNLGTALRQGALVRTAFSPHEAVFEAGGPLSPTALSQLEGAISRQAQTTGKAPSVQWKLSYPLHGDYDEHLWEEHGAGEGVEGRGWDHFLAHPVTGDLQQRYDRWLHTQDPGKVQGMRNNAPKLAPAPSAPPTPAPAAGLPSAHDIVRESWAQNAAPRQGWLGTTKKGFAFGSLTYKTQLGAECDKKSPKSGEKSPERAQTGQEGARKSLNAPHPGLGEPAAVGASAVLVPVIAAASGERGERARAYQLTKSLWGDGTLRKARTPDESLRQLAQAYHSAHQSQLGLQPYQHPDYAPLDPELSQATARYYDQAPSFDLTPDVKASYDALKRETLAQYGHLVGHGYQLTPWGNEDPYPNSEAMMQDVRQNRRLGFYQGGDMDASHPLAEAIPAGTPGAHPGMTYNDAFRAVHDFLGHAVEGYQFGPRGEYNATLAHAQLYSPQAHPALVSETHGQNSWVNFGPHSHLPVAERPFAEQKVFQLPRHLFPAPLQGTPQSSEVGGQNAPAPLRGAPATLKRALQFTFSQARELHKSFRWSTLAKALGDAGYDPNDMREGFWLTPDNRHLDVGTHYHAEALDPHEIAAALQARQLPFEYNQGGEWDWDGLADAAHRLGWVRGSVYPAGPRGEKPSVHYLASLEEGQNPAPLLRRMQDHHAARYPNEEPNVGLYAGGKFVAFKPQAHTGWSDQFKEHYRQARLGKGIDARSAARRFELELKHRLGQATTKDYDELFTLQDEHDVAKGIDDTGFHGTAEKWLPRIMEQGLRHRRETGIKNFGKIPNGGHDQTSKLPGVYYTTDPGRAAHIALGAGAKRKTPGAIVAARVDPTQAMGDEDYPEYLANNLGSVSPHYRMEPSGPNSRRSIPVSEPWFDVNSAASIRQAAQQALTGAGSGRLDDVVQAPHGLSDDKVVRAYQVSQLKQGEYHPGLYDEMYRQMNEVLGPRETWEHFGSSAFPSSGPGAILGAVTIPQVPREKHQASLDRIAPLAELLQGFRDDPERALAQLRERQPVPGMQVYDGPGLGKSLAPDGEVGYFVILPPEPAFVFTKALGGYRVSPQPIRVLHTGADMAEEHYPFAVHWGDEHLGDVTYRPGAEGKLYPEWQGDVDQGENVFDPELWPHLEKQIIQSFQRPEARNRIASSPVPVPHPAAYLENPEHGDYADPGEVAALLSRLGSGTPQVTDATRIPWGFPNARDYGKQGYLTPTGKLWVPRKGAIPHPDHLGYQGVLDDHYLAHGYLPLELQNRLYATADRQVTPAQLDTLRQLHLGSPEKYQPRIYGGAGSRATSYPDFHAAVSREQHTLSHLTQRMREEGQWDQHTSAMPGEWWRESKGFGKALVATRETCSHCGAEHEWDSESDRCNHCGKTSTHGAVAKSVDPAHPLEARLAATHGTLHPDQVMPNERGQAFLGFVGPSGAISGKHDPPSHGHVLAEALGGTVDPYEQHRRVQDVLQQGFVRMTSGPRFGYGAKSWDGTAAPPLFIQQGAAPLAPGAFAAVKRLARNHGDFDWEAGDQQGASLASYLRYHQDPEGYRTQADEDARRRFFGKSFAFAKAVNGFHVEPGPQTVTHGAVEKDEAPSAAPVRQGVAFRGKSFAFGKDKVTG